MTSTFATRNEPLFTNREEICDYLHVMLTHKFFHRAQKVPVNEQELKGKKGKKKEKKGQESAEEENKDIKEKDKGTDAESSVVEGSKEQQQV